MRKIGDKEAVYYGEAEKTPGGLTRDDLIVNKKGKIISKAQHANGLKKVEALKQSRESKAGGNLFSYATREMPEHKIFYTQLGH